MWSEPVTAEVKERTIVKPTGDIEFAMRERSRGMP